MKWDLPREVGRRRDCPRGPFGHGLPTAVKLGRHATQGLPRGSERTRHSRPPLWSSLGAKPARGPERPRAREGTLGTPPRPCRTWRWRTMGQGIKSDVRADAGRWNRRWLGGKRPLRRRSPHLSHWFPPWFSRLASGQSLATLASPLRVESVSREPTGLPRGRWVRRPPSIDRRNQPTDSRGYSRARYSCRPADRFGVTFVRRSLSSQ